ncbi:hypothetical protein SAMN05443245_5237 [Paraburkholderia fungorum]|uniref:Uncharacterized protein n=1 Tax=Paraburkholderia fungorum TaxID=134537 RepID=A0A1H1IIF5_9BURK|nr:hypothetical protein [Paraburkholderia fungorum]SDR37545.1 hypothetical protein SAMN05443245_5237 [Paraburkholderia fungorum]
MNAAQVAALKDSILSMAAAIKVDRNSHNIRILNRACGDLLEATGEVFSCGEFINLQTVKLVSAMEKHEVNARILPTGLILAEEQYAGEGFPDAACELYGPYWTVVEPTMSAVREWLGY